MKNELKNRNMNFRIKEDEVLQNTLSKLNQAVEQGNIKIPHLKTGTTTVALKTKEGVCLATDNRATMGFLVADKHAQKLHKITDYMYLTIAGGVADAQYLIELLKAETYIFNLKHDQMKVGQAAKLLQNILFKNKGEYGVGLILGGYTELEGPKLYNLGGYGSSLEDDFTSTGSGSPFAYGVLEDEWRDDLTLEEGMKICARAVRSAIIRDIASGNGIDIVGIDKNGVIEKRYEITDKQIQ